MSGPVKLTLLALVACLTSGAPSALAQTEPLVHDPVPELTATFEPTTIPCRDIIAGTGGCRLHASGANIVLVSHVFGVEAVDSTCNMEFDSRIDRTVEGYLTHLEMTQGSQGACTRRACGQVAPPASEGRSWSVYGRETGPGVRSITFLMCLWTTTGFTDTHCEVSIPFTEPVNHRYTFTATDSACHGMAGFPGELTGTFNVEATLGTTQEGQTEEQVEINHT